MGTAKGPYPLSKRKDIFVDSRIYESFAYSKLTVSACRVLGMFQRKRKMEKRGREGKEYWVVANNGELIFTYREAERKGISQKSFQRSIDKLIEVGFLSISEYGMGTLGGAATKYSFDERWMDYGTDKFKVAKRQKRIGNPGFKSKEQ